VYKDNFAIDRETELFESGQIDEYNRRLVANPETSGRYHSDWLTMMYPRLKLARNLLTDDGVIFISIDDNEVHNLRKLCDEVFGEGNFIAGIANINNPKGRSDDKYVATAHEYLLLYSKDIIQLNWYGFEPTEEIIKRYNKIDEFGKKYREIDLRKTGENDLREDRPNLFYYFHYNNTTGDFYPTKNEFAPDGYISIYPQREDRKEGNWRWSFDTAKKQISELIPKYMPSRKIWGIMQKDYLEGRDLVKPTSSWTFKDVNSERGTEQFIALGFDKRIFPKPKPIGTIIRLLNLSTVNNDIILDFFSGSATTAHAVMQLNAEDGGKRKYIMVQLPELTDEKSEAYKAGYKNICEIGKERIRRAGKKVASEQWSAISDETKKKYGCKELSRTDSLAKSHGAKQTSLFDCEKTSEGGTVCSVGSNEAGGSVDTVEHSRGTGEEFNEGVSAISVNSTGIESGTGNAAADVRKSGIPCRFGYFGSDGTLAGSEQNDSCPYKNTNLCPLITDIGFRVYRLDSSNMKDVYYRPQDYKQETLDMFADNIKPDRTADDLLAQVMLDWGLPLSYKIEQIDINGKQVFRVAQDSLLACFDTGIDEDFAKEIAKEKPLRVVFRDSGFADDTAKINVQQLLKQLTPETEMKVI
jgi:hypothetical protein